MFKKSYIAAVGVLLVGGGAYYMWSQNRAWNPATPPGETEQEISQEIIATIRNYLSLTEEDWEKILTPEQYYILREKGTETPYSSPLDEETRPGTYVAADCNEPVFRSEQKYDSGTGWPSFWAPISPDALVLKQDTDLLSGRTEVLSRCGGHLGHVFEDGPPPTGLRYCMNGDALKFIPDQPVTQQTQSSPAPERVSDSGIRGTVTIGPTCPVETMPPDPACADKPYAALLNIATQDGVLVQQVQAQNDGSFEAALPAGVYVIAQAEGKIYPMLKPVTVTVQEGQFTAIQLQMDSGIR